jgi:hypothetical protein
MPTIWLTGGLAAVKYVIAKLTHVTHCIVKTPTTMR